MAVLEQTTNPAEVRQPHEIAVKNPVTGEVIGALPVQSEDNVREAVARARAAQPAWDILGVKERGWLLRRWAKLLWDGREEMMRVIRRETGKNDASALIEVVLAENTVTYYARHAPRLLRPQQRSTLFPVVQKARVYYKPHGIVGCITPWNYPLFMGLVDVLPALIAGNAVLLKPSELTPYSALHAVELMHRAGIPVDVIQIMTGDGHTGAAVVEHVDYLSFTGSTATGRKIAVRCAERLIPYSLELGGKDPLIVLQDGNLEMAASTALCSGLENAGQVCVSTERVYVEAPVYDSFVERVRQYAQLLRFGPGDGMDIHLGSITSERELQRTEAQIADAVAKGAQVLCGGKRRSDLGPLFFEPTVLINVDHTMEVMREETFGPIVPIMRVADADEAIRLANDNIYGLSASIFTGDLKRGEALAQRIESGDVSINRAQLVYGTPTLPMGGEKDSGVGRRNGPEGLMRFVKPQSILVDNLIGATPLLGYGEDAMLKPILILRTLRRYLPFLRL